MRLDKGFVTETNHRMHPRACQVWLAKIAQTSRLAATRPPPRASQLIITMRVLFTPTDHCATMSCSEDASCINTGSGAVCLCNLGYELNDGTGACEGMYWQIIVSDAG